MMSRRRNRAFRGVKSRKTVQTMAEVMAVAQAGAWFTAGGRAVKQHGPYFEGWYLKHRTRQGDALALIPACHVDGEGRRSAYLWTQCVWQESSLNSLMLSAAAIPLAGGRFTGCICAVVDRGREYRLATYRGARVERWSGAGAVIRQGKYRLSVELLKGEGCPLRAPAGGVMGRTVQESLCSTVRYRFWAGETLLLDHTDRCAGFEYAET